MEHLIIKEKGNIIYKTAKNKLLIEHDEILNKIVYALIHLSDQFLDSKLISYSINNYLVEYKKISEDIEFVVVSGKNFSIIDEVIEQYALAKDKNDFKILKNALENFE
ncbi:hypothetical protein GVAV_000293 [Gurleya vavrai]